MMLVTVIVMMVMMKMLTENSDALRCVVRNLDEENLTGKRRELITRAERGSFLRQSFDRNGDRRLRVSRSRTISLVKSHVMQTNRLAPHECPAAYTGIGCPIG